MKLINFVIIFSFAWLGASCVPEEGFIKEGESLEVTSGKESNEEVETPTSEKSVSHILSFEEMVEQMQVRLNNNHLDSGRSAYFTAQAPFSSTDSLIVYTQSKCTGKTQEVPFHNFTSLPLSPQVNTEEKKYIYQRDPNLVFMATLLDQNLK